MADAAAVPVPPAAPAPRSRTGFGPRAYMLAACSMGGTLCASLAANSNVNLVFVIGSAFFGALIVLLTAAPASGQVSAAMSAENVPLPVSSEVRSTTITTHQRTPGLGSSIAIGIVAAVLSFIMNQIAQVAFGFVAFNLVPAELSGEQLAYVTTFIGIGVMIVKTPFDVFIGAFHLSRARNVLVALGLFVLTYFVCYAIEQMVSMTMGASGLLTTVSTFGLEGLLWGMFYVIGLPTIAQALGAYGVGLAALLPRRSAAQ